MEGHNIWEDIYDIAAITTPVEVDIVAGGSFYITKLAMVLMSKPPLPAPYLPLSLEFLYLCVQPSSLPPPCLPSMPLYSTMFLPSSLIIYSYMSASISMSPYYTSAGTSVSLSVSSSLSVSPYPSLFTSPYFSPYPYLSPSPSPYQNIFVYKIYILYMFCDIFF